MNQISLSDLQMSSHSSIETPDLDALIERTWNVTDAKKWSDLRSLLSPDEMKRLPEKPNGGNLVGMCAQLMLSNSNKANQFMLQGAPSAGKSTELQRIAWSLSNSEEYKKYNRKKVVHHCSFQFLMENIGPIRNKNDLWAAIIACHSSEDFQLWNPTFSEFAQLHADSNYQPILLIDTLDFLAYGIDKDELPHVVTAWKELTTHMEQTNMKVLWTCRTEEANLFDVGNTNIVEIKLPTLDTIKCKEQASKLLDNPNFDKSLSRSPNLLEPVWVVMLMNFPIINIYMRKQDDIRRPASTYGQRILRGLERLSIGTDDTPANPVVWVMNQLDNMLPMDVMYELVVEKIIEELSSRTRFEEGEIKEHWEEYVESRFYNAALTKHHKYGSRLVVSNTIPGLRPEIHALVNEFHTAGERYGILKKVNQTIHFTHQLFAEYVLFKTIKSYGGSVDRYIDKFPSIKIRHDGYASDSTMKEQFKRWFIPYFAYSDLYKHERFAELPDYEDAYNLSKRAHGVRDKLNLWEEDVNDEKRALFKRFSTEFREYPTSINGPAGTGKTFIAPRFIHTEYNKYHQSEIEESDIFTANFFTLSRNLSKSFAENSYNEYIRKSKLVDRIHLNNRDVDQLLFELSVYVLGKEITFNEFSDSLLTESKFLERITDYRRHQYTRDLVSRYSSYALWHEFCRHGFSGIGRAVEEMYGERLDSESIFDFDANSNSSDDDRNAFIDFLKKYNWIGHESQIIQKTRGHIASEIIEELIRYFYSQDSQDDGLAIRERLAPYRSNVLIVDEYQDLDHSLTFLFLLLHKGEAESILFMGDNEQTLHFDEFNWTRHFGKLGVFVSKLVDEQPWLGGLEQYRINDPLRIRRWLDKTLMADLGNDTRLEKLTQVERNVPPIVLFLRDSYRSSVTETDRDIRVVDIGTSKVVPGKYSYVRLEHHLEQNKLEDGTQPYSGVSWIQRQDERISQENLIELCKSIYEQNSVIGLIFPNERLEIETRERLKSEGSGISLPLWNPTSIKGLEFKVVIALSPWSIDNNRFKQLVPNFDLTRPWSEHETTLPDRRGHYKRRMMKLLSQTRRHANVMLSRPMHHLIVLELEDTSFELTDTIPPKQSEEMKTENAKLSTLPNFASLLDYLLDNSLNKDDFVEMVRHLSQLIEAGAPIGNILSHASHLSHLMEKAGTTDSVIVPFLLMRLHRDKRNIRARDEKRAEGGEIVISGLQSLIFGPEFKSRTKKVQQNKAVVSDKRLESYQQKIHQIYLNTENVEGDIVSPLYMSIQGYESFIETYRAIITMASIVDIVPINDRSTSIDPLKDEDVSSIQHWIVEHILPDNMAKTESSQWFEIIRFFDFRRDALRFNRKLLKTQDSPLDMFFSFNELPNEKDGPYRERTGYDRIKREAKFSHDQEFWRKGCQLIQNGNHDDDVRSVWPGISKQLRRNEENSEKVIRSFDQYRSLLLMRLTTYDGLAFYEFLSDMNSISMLRSDDVPALSNATSIEALIDNANNGHDLAERMFEISSLSVSEIEMLDSVLNQNDEGFLPHVLNWLESTYTVEPDWNAEVFMKLLKFCQFTRQPNQSTLSQMIDEMSMKIPVSSMIENQFEFTAEGRPLLRGSPAENKLLLTSTDVELWGQLPGKKAIATMYAIHLFNQFKRIDVEYLATGKGASTLEVFLKMDDGELSWSDVMGEMDFDAITASLFQLANEQMNANEQFLTDSTGIDGSKATAFTFELVFEPGEFAKSAEFKYCSILNRAFGVTSELFEKKQAVSESLRVRKVIEFKKLMTEFAKLRREIHYGKQMSDSAENRVLLKSWNARLEEISSAVYMDRPDIYPGHEAYVNQFDEYHPGMSSDTVVRADSIDPNTVFQHNPLWDIEVRNQLIQLFPPNTNAVEFAKVSSWNRTVVDAFIASEQNSPLDGYVYRFGIPIRHTNAPGSTRYIGLHQYLVLDRFCTSLRALGCTISDEPVTLRNFLITVHNSFEKLYEELPLRMMRNNMWKKILEQITVPMNGTLEEAWEEDWSDDQPGKILFDWYHKLGFFDLKKERGNHEDHFIHIESQEGAEIKGVPPSGLEGQDFGRYLNHLESERGLIYDRRTMDQLQSSNSIEDTTYATQILAKLGYHI